MVMTAPQAVALLRENTTLISPADVEEYRRNISRVLSDKSLNPNTGEKKVPLFPSHFIMIFIIII
jgi:hypothetical protein